MKGLNIILKPEKGKAKKLTGDQSLLILEAVRLVLENVNAQSIVSDNQIDMIDRKAPEGFSYVEEAVIALTAGKKTTLEIANYILQKRQESF
jgi:hypothetical protein